MFPRHTNSGMYAYYNKSTEGIAERQAIGSFIHAIFVGDGRLFVGLRVGALVGCESVQYVIKSAKLQYIIQITSKHISVKSSETIGTHASTRSPRSPRRTGPGIRLLWIRPVVIAIVNLARRPHIRTVQPSLPLTTALRPSTFVAFRFRRPGAVAAAGSGVGHAIIWRRAGVGRTSIWRGRRRPWVRAAIIVAGGEWRVPLV